MTFETSVQAFSQGGVLAYPTEAVFGLGCDPDNEQAVHKLLDIKQRPVDKGLILLASDYAQLAPYIDESSLTADMLNTIQSRWPDGITQVLPAHPNTPSWLTGRFYSIAVRITSQADVVALCEATNKPVVSTSANLTGQLPCKTWQEVEQALDSKVDFVVKGETLGFDQPSTIIDGLTGEVFRA